MTSKPQLSPILCAAVVTSGGNFLLRKLKLKSRATWFFKVVTFAISFMSGGQGVDKHL